jgi:excisionase family DNA binding protein
MKLDLEASDIDAIARQVTKTLLPHLERQGDTERDAVFTANELAEYLKVKQSWVYDRVKKKAVPHFKLGKYLRFKKSAIDRWIRESSIK